MGTHTALLTVDEFLAMPEDPRFRQELIGGEVVTMSRAGAVHEFVKSNVLLILAAYLLKNRLGRMLAETSFRLTPNDSPMPDVSLVLLNRLPPDKEGLIQGSPELAVEVVSSETAAFLEHKVSLYLAHGSRAVWVIYPRDAAVYAHRSSGEIRRYSGEEVLEEPELLPGFQTPVSAFFEGI